MANELRLGRKRLRKAAPLLAWDPGEMTEWVVDLLAGIAGCDEDEPAQIPLDVSTDPLLDSQEFDMALLTLDLWRVSHRRACFVVRDNDEAAALVKKAKTLKVPLVDLLSGTEAEVHRYDNNDAVGYWLPMHAGDFDARKTYWRGKKPEAVAFVHSETPGVGLMDRRFAATVSKTLCVNEDDFEEILGMASNTDAGGVLKPKTAKKFVREVRERYFNLVSTTAPQWRAMSGLSKFRVSIAPLKPHGEHLRVAPAQPEFLYSRPEFTDVDRAFILVAAS